MNKTIVLILSLLICMSCSNQEGKFQDEQPEALCNVKLELAGFDVSVETRAASTKTIYGINVYYDKEKDGVQKGSSLEKHCLYFFLACSVTQLCLTL